MWRVWIPDDTVLLTARLVAGAFSRCAAHTQYKFIPSMFTSAPFNCAGKLLRPCGSVWCTCTTAVLHTARRAVYSQQGLAGVEIVVEGCWLRVTSYWDLHGMLSPSIVIPIKMAEYTGSSKKMDGIWHRYNLKSTRRIYKFGILKCSEV